MQRRAGLPQRVNRVVAIPLPRRGRAIQPRDGAVVDWSYLRSAIRAEPLFYTESRHKHSAGRVNLCKINWLRHSAQFGVSAGRCVQCLGMRVRPQPLLPNRCVLPGGGAEYWHARGPVGRLPKPRAR